MHCPRPWRHGRRGEAGKPARGWAKGRYAKPSDRAGRRTALVSGRPVGRPVCGKQSGLRCRKSAVVPCGSSSSLSSGVPFGLSPPFPGSPSWMRELVRCRLPEPRSAGRHCAWRLLPGSPLVREVGCDRDGAPHPEKAKRSSVSERRRGALRRAVSRGAAIHRRRAWKNPLARPTEVSDALDIDWSRPR